MLKFVMRQGISRGLFGGNRFFATLGAVAAFIRILQRVAKVGERTIYTHKLKPGEVMILTEPVAAKKSSRRRANRSIRHKK